MGEDELESHHFSTVHHYGNQRKKLREGTKGVTNGHKLEFGPRKGFLPKFLPGGFLLKRGKQKRVTTNTNRNLSVTRALVGTKGGVLLPCHGYFRLL